MSEVEAGRSVRSASRDAAMQTWRAAARLERSPVPPDPSTKSNGHVWPRPAYDSGTTPPDLPNGSLAARLQRMGVDATHKAVCELLEEPGVTLTKHGRARRRGVRALLAWLWDFPGETWEDRWLLSGLDAAPRTWMETVRPEVKLPAGTLSSALSWLLLARVLRPSYAWLLAASQHSRNPAVFLEVNEPETVQRLRALPAYQAASELARRNAEMCLTRLLIRTGKSIDQLRGDDLMEYADVVRTSTMKHKEHLAWELLIAMGPLAGEPPTLRAAWAASTRTRQHSVATLVDRYGIPPSPVRDLLVEYLTEVKDGMDYGSLAGLAHRLVRLFWAGVLEINPEQKDLHLSKEVAIEWRERLAVTLDGGPRREMHSTIFGVRAFYRDLSEWSYAEPERWAVWVAPCPIPKSVSKSFAKAKRHRRARMHDRTRMLTPNLPTFRSAAAAAKDHGARLLEATMTASHGEQYQVDGVTYERHDPPIYSTMPSRAAVWCNVVDVAPGAASPPLERGRVNATRIEADAFWAWAVIETLSETGVRIEELLEVTQLSLRHYVAPTTNTIIPLLHIVPSKTDAERLIPMSPDLIKVLVEVQRRARGSSSTIPLSVRYDPTEKVFSDSMPHLFARLVGARQEVLSMGYIRTILQKVADRAGIMDAGQPVHFTPHDFRRLLSTDLVGSGLPLHIVATLLGHLNLETTRGYTAVFPEEVVQAHQAFTERRRATRPEGEFRPATDDEWSEFEQHFLLRKVALGDCHRPYATPCVHESACARCRFLDVDPDQTQRIEDMTENAESRLEEARANVWLGEVAALEESLVHLRRRLDEANTKRQAHTGITQT